MEFTQHFRQMFEERSIKKEWIDRTIHAPDKKENHADGTTHFIKQIPEHGNRWLRVVLNADVQPHRAITVFFDRRLRRYTHED